MRILFFNPEQYVDFEDEPSNYELRLPILNCGLDIEHRDYIYQRVLRSQGRDAMNAKALEEVQEFKPDLVVYSTSPNESLDSSVLQQIMKLGIPVYIHVWDTHVKPGPHEREWFDNCNYFGVADSVTNYLKYKIQAKNHARIIGVIFTGGHNVFTDFFCSNNTPKKYEVTIIGSNEGQRVELIKYLKKNLEAYSIKIHKFGGLVDSTKGVGRLTDNWVSWEKYREIISSSSICLSSPTQPTRQQVKGKIFDYLACGSFCLSEYNREVSQIIPEDCIAYYKDFDDCLRKIVHYTTHQEERERIARNGYNWFQQTSNYKKFWSSFIEAAVNKSGELPEIEFKFKKAKTSLLFKQGNWLNRRNKLIEAVVTYYQVIDKNSKFSWYYHKLGNTLLKLGNLEEAIVAYNSALKIKPNSATFHFSLGDALVEKGLLDEAASHYQTVIKLKPHSSIGQKKLAQLAKDIELHRSLKQITCHASSTMEELYGPQNLFLGDLMIWHSQSPPEYPEWLEFELLKPQKWQGISIKPHQGHYERAPSTFTIMGSNDKQEWESLLSVSDYKWVSDNWHQWNFEPSDKYKYYKMEIFANNGHPDFLTIERLAPIIDNANIKQI